MKEKPPGEGQTPTPPVPSKEEDNDVLLPNVERAVDWRGRGVPYCLRRALAADLQDILVLGYHQDGELFVSSSRGLKNDLALFMLEQVKAYLLEGQ